jgi:4-hydroxy-tetrahydrodipicolinate synthase
MDVISQKPDDFVVLSGDDNLTVPLIFMGGKGVISVATNIMPKEVSDMVDAAIKGDMKKAVSMHYKLLPFFKSMFIETNPIPVKTALAMQGMVKEVFRLPMCSMEPENKAKLKKVMTDYGLLK